MPDPRPRADHVDRWLSIAAAVGAICAVAISLYQAALAREQQRASAWPYVAQSNGFMPGTPYVRRVENEGVGPARVRSYQVLVDGRAVPTWGAAMRALTDTIDASAVFSSIGRGSVLPPGATLTVLQIPPGAEAVAFWRAAQTRLETVVCYCSIYDECWISDTRTDEPAPVRACPDYGDAAFRN